MKTECSETFCNDPDHRHEAEGRPVDYGPNTEALIALGEKLPKSGAWAYTAICAYCGKTRDKHWKGAFSDELPVGRRPRYCSDACRQAAYRARKAAKRASVEEAVAFMESFDPSSFD